MIARLAIDVRTKRGVIGWTIAIACLSCPVDDAAAQGRETPAADELIDVAKDLYRLPGILARCAPASEREIVVCAPDRDQYRVSSPTDDAIAAGDPVFDGIPRAPDVLDWPPCVPTIFNNYCARAFRTAPLPLLIDLGALPEALTPEEGASVFSADRASEQK